MAMDLGLFSYVCAVCWIPFIPGAFWEWILRPLPKSAASVERRVGKPALRWSVNTVVGVLLIYVFLWNLTTLDFSKYRKIFPKRIDCIGFVLRLDQHWNLFAPNPMVQDGWFVISGTLRNGSQVDLYKAGGKVSWEKPEEVRKTFKNRRWRKYLVKLYGDRDEDDLRHYSEYLCRCWNKNHQGEEIVGRLELDYMLEKTLPNYKTPKVEKVKIWSHECLAED